MRFSIKSANSDWPISDFQNKHQLAQTEIRAKVTYFILAFTRMFV